MGPHADKVQTRHPDGSKKMPRIQRTFYDAFRRAILESLPRSGPGLPFAELSRKVAPKLPASVKKAIGSVSWYATTIKLDLEARGEIERVPGSRPQRLRRTD